MGRPRQDITLDLFLRLFELDEPEEVVVFTAEPPVLNKPVRRKAPEVSREQRRDTLVYENVVELTTSRTSVRYLVKPGLNRDYAIPFQVDEEGVRAIVRKDIFEETEGLPSDEEMDHYGMPPETMMAFRKMKQDCRIPGWPVNLQEVAYWAENCLDMDEDQIEVIRRRYRVISGKRRGPEPEITDEMLDYADEVYKKNEGTWEKATRAAASKFFPDDPELQTKAESIARKLRDRRKEHRERAAGAQTS